MGHLNFHERTSPDLYPPTRPFRVTLPGVGPGANVWDSGQCLGVGTFTDTPLRTGTPLSPANHFHILVVSDSGRTSWGPGLESASWDFICDTAKHARNGEPASVEDPEKRSISFWHHRAREWLGSGRRRQAADRWVAQKLPGCLITTVPYVCRVQRGHSPTWT
jgi:hypothetical protein